MSQPTVVTGAPSAATASWPASRCSGLRLAITIDAPSRANSSAIALPRPVPAPVMNTAVPSKVPAGSALSPSGGGAGRPGRAVLMTSAPGEVRGAALGAGGAELGQVVGLGDERLRDEL